MKNSKNIKIEFLVVFILAVLGVLTTLVARITSEPHWRFWKILSASWFVSIAIFAFIYNKQGRSKITVAIACASLFGILGDILLEYQFLVGMVAFAIDHILLLIVFLWMQKLRMRDITIFTILAVPFGILLGFFDNYGNMLIPVIIYAILILAMTSKAISVAIDKKTRFELSAFFAFGSLLFLISDAILSIHLFTSFEFRSSIHPFIMFTYVLGQCLLASSILYIQKLDVKKTANQLPKNTTINYMGQAESTSLTAQDTIDASTINSTAFNHNQIISNAQSDTISLRNDIEKDTTIFENSIAIKNPLE